MPLSIRPLHDHVIVKRIDSDSRTPGGLIIPSNAKEQSAEGTVEAVGPGIGLADGKTRPIDVAVGDRVLFRRYTENEIKIDGEMYLLLKESDLLCVVG